MLYKKSLITFLHLGCMFISLEAYSSQQKELSYMEERNNPLILYRNNRLDCIAAIGSALQGLPSSGAKKISITIGGDTLVKEDAQINKSKGYIKEHIKLQDHSVFESTRMTTRKSSGIKGAYKGIGIEGKYGGKTKRHTKRDAKNIDKDKTNEKEWNEMIIVAPAREKIIQGELNIQIVRGNTYYSQVDDNNQEN